MSTRFMTKSIVVAAVDAYWESMVAFCKANKKNGFHLVAWDPTKVGQAGLSHSNVFTSLSFQKDRWGASPYETIAIGKSSLSQRTQMNSGDVPRELLLPGECKYRGGVYTPTLGVSISGFKSVVDESFSLSIAKLAIDLANDAFEEWNKENDREPFV